MLTKAFQYIQLTKPTIMLLVVVTGGTALVWEGSLLTQPFRFALVLLALYLTGGSANALNQYFEREIDARMKRTSKRRPLPSGRLTPGQALTFSISIGLAGVAIFYFWFNWQAALLSFLTILFYALLYTLVLKPNSPQNIVIGGAAGAMVPVGAWVAASGQMAVAPWLLFLLVFLWTPPHFWALAIYCRDDYVKAKLPMMPLVKGDESTLRQILVYSILVVVASLLPLIYGLSWLYLGVAIPLGVVFMRKVLAARRLRTEASVRSLFGYSIVYLFGIFAAIGASSLLVGRLGW